MDNFQIIQTQGVDIKLWASEVSVEEQARQQLINIASMSIVSPHVAVMPDVHMGIGATVGSVIPTVKAIIPAAVGVDIGCGMIAMRTSLTASDLPESLAEIRSAIERAVPHGHSRGARDKGAWGNVPAHVGTIWKNKLEKEYDDIMKEYPELKGAKNVTQLGTLGGGNHFIEICIDEEQRVWVMLHSGSRGIGNAIGSMFTELAKKDAMRNNAHLPDEDLAYLEEGSLYFADYVKSVSWAQQFALHSRNIMLERVLNVLRENIPISFTTEKLAINCHHNYVKKEMHFGQEVYLTRKGAVCAEEGVYGIIPGSMGAKSYIVRGKGNPQSFNSCSHGAGRSMSRNKAKQTFTVQDQIAATAGVECRKDAGVIDEIPLAYKSIEAVMRSQKDLVEIVHELKQVVCVKG